MDDWSEDDFDDGEVSFGARSRTRSGVTFSLPSTEDSERRGSRKSPARRSQQHHAESLNDASVEIEMNSSESPTGEVSSDRRSKQRISSERRRVSAAVHHDSAESASEVESASEASDQEQYQTCPSDVDQSRVSAKRRSNKKSRDVGCESSKSKSEVTTSKSRSSLTKSNRSTRMLPQVRLGMFRGESCLETFLVKFEDLSLYMRWTEEDRLFHLRASLDGVAGQILWDAGPQTSTASVIRLLRVRFGNEHQAERFRAELRSR